MSESEREMEGGGERERERERENENEREDVRGGSNPFRGNLVTLLYIHNE